MSFLRRDLRDTNLAAQRRNGRVPLRRLTRGEYEHTLHDLLGIHSELAKHLPPENDSSSFDTVSTAQGLSPVHVRSYLAAADMALDEAIKLGRRPRRAPRKIDYLNSPYVEKSHDIPIRNGESITKKLDDAVALFVDRKYITRSDRSKGGCPSARARWP